MLTPTVVIDGRNYVPEDSAARPEAPSSSVGVAISTHNRRDVYLRTVEHWRRFLPAGAVLEIVDDASDIPAPGATFRYDTNVGIARCKNKCLELLMRHPNVHNLFLVDDDFYPAKPGWEQIYINNPEPHLQYLFKDGTPQGPDPNRPPTIYDDGTTFAYREPRGQFLYVTREVVNRVGGMRPEFHIWGYEHIEYSDRIHSAMLTTFPYQDACGSKSGYFVSYDEMAYQRRSGVPSGFSRSVDPHKRKSSLEHNRILCEKFKGSADYVEYREPQNLVITTLLTKHGDPQRNNQKLAPDANLIGKWRGSLQDCQAIVLTDELETTDPIFIKVPTGLSNPYLQRWVSIYQYLRNHKVQWVWCTDGTDVTMQHTPWGAMEAGKLYVGDEPTIVNIPWMRTFNSPYARWIRSTSQLKLVNAGIIGGDYDTVIDFVNDMTCQIFLKVAEPGILLDMGPFNWLCYSEKWRSRVISGRQVNTEFKQYKPNDHSWWMHK